MRDAGDVCDNVFTHVHVQCPLLYALVIGINEKELRPKLSGN